MGLVGMILGLPFAPFRGLVRLAEVIQEQVERELYDPAAVRRRIEEIERAAAAGELSKEERAAAVEEALGGMTGPVRG
ncbi:gas vesicle protein GvpG [Thermoactinospora rubra]|uniref:gas vesicle protein GvpG n=1 Tax=Thermoactinospora rubra TaxID=1088767 RepID=UPI000A11EF4D|nr:gas vesicle protein GvpG [Thermoactinospora rubra]